jgi:hypothetical protein
MVRERVTGMLLSLADLRLLRRYFAFSQGATRATWKHGFKRCYSRRNPMRLLSEGSAFPPTLPGGVERRTETHQGGPRVSPVLPGCDMHVLSLLECAAACSCSLVHGAAGTRSAAQLVWRRVEPIRS